MESFDLAPQKNDPVCMTVYKLQKHVRLVSPALPPGAGGAPAWGDCTVASRPVLAQGVVLGPREVLTIIARHLLS